MNEALCELKEAMEQSFPTVALWSARNGDWTENEMSYMEVALKLVRDLENEDAWSQMEKEENEDVYEEVAIEDKQTSWMRCRCERMKPGAVPALGCVPGAGDIDGLWILRGKRQGSFLQEHEVSLLLQSNSYAIEGRSARAPQSSSGWRCRVGS